MLTEKVYYGKNLNPEHMFDITCIVMSTNSNPLTKYSLDSIKENKNNDIKVQIIVVNTGNGSLIQYLNDYLDDIILVELEQKMFAGGTRNLGVKYSTSPIIAFLACDCLITENWFEHQISRHLSVNAVASAIQPKPNSCGKVSKIVMANYIVTHFHRMPEVKFRKTELYGVSYKKMIFDKYGLFDENVRVGEDSLFNKRISEYEPIYWEPNIITLHTYQNNIKKSLKEQFERGFREFAFHKEFGAKKIRFIYSKSKYYCTILSKVITKDLYSKEMKLSIFLCILLLVFRMLGVLLSNLNSHIVK